MLRYIVQRVLQLIPILIGISVFTFLMLHLVPGDPVLIFAGDKPLTEERAAEIRHELGLDRPIWVQYRDYIGTARAKGLAPGVVVLRHALKNALIPTITMLGLQLGALLGGAVVTETIFSRPGLGRLAVDAILSRDFPLVQGTVLFAAVAYVLVNLLVDISYAAVDPRIHYG